MKALLKEMASIQLTRTSEYNNYLRDYTIYIDGRKAGTISNGETKTFPLTPGRHTLTAKIDWCSSPVLAFTITENEIKTYKVGGFKNGNWIIPLTLILLFSFYFVSSPPIINALFYFIIVIGFLLITYFLTIGRKKYLSLYEDTAHKYV